MISHDTSQRVVFVLSVPMISHDTVKDSFRVVSNNDLTRHVSKSRFVLSVPVICYHTEDEYQNDNKSPRLPILTASIVVDVLDQ